MSRFKDTYPWNPHVNTLLLAYVTCMGIKIFTMKLHGWCVMSCNWTPPSHSHDISTSQSEARNRVFWPMRGKALAPSQTECNQSLSLIHVNCSDIIIWIDPLTPDKENMMEKMETVLYLTWNPNKTKYFRLRLSDEVSKESWETALREMKEQLEELSQKD